MSKTATTKTAAVKPVKGYKEIGQYMVIDPRVCFGKLTFKGTRVPVATILTYLAKGDTFDQLQRSWPRVSREAIQEAIQLAAHALVEVTASGTVFPKAGSIRPDRPVLRQT